MKRPIAILVFLAAGALFVKLAIKPTGLAPSQALTHGTAAAGARLEGAPTGRITDAKSNLVEKYASETPAVRALVKRVAEKFGRNAHVIDGTDGLRGLVLLDRLDLEALFLYEKHPAEFRQLRNSVGGDAAADLLLHWREYFGQKRADDLDRGLLISEIAGLSAAQKRIATKYPSMLPLILTDPARVTEFCARLDGDPGRQADLLALLSLISLEHGPDDLRLAMRTIEEHEALALAAFRSRGLKGFMLVNLYGPVLESLASGLPTDQALILLEVNADYVDDLLRTHRCETVAGHLRHVGAAGLTEAVGGSPHGLRLVVEYGELGERALRRVGAEAADVVIDNFDDPTLRRQALQAIAAHGSMALAMLDKYALDADFRAILKRDGPAIIPPIAQTDAGPDVVARLSSETHRSFTQSLALAALFVSGDNGQATIRTIKNDGLARVAELNQSEIRFYQFLPLYDVIHFGNVLRRGYWPTSSEMTWAVIDGCFVVTDVLSLAAAQPAGAVAGEALRTEVKATVRQGARSTSRELVGRTVESAGAGLARSGAKRETSRVARWWAVRSAGGVFEVMRRTPEALPRLTVAQVAEMAGPLAKRAGIRLSSWGPIRVFKDGAEVVLRIPPERGLKYLAAQAAQAGVGVVGIQKMNEHLSSRRPNKS
jgi:hypothetical protein